MNKLILSIYIYFSVITIGYSQNSLDHKIRVEIENDAFMCPNLGMKKKRTLIQRKSQIDNWLVASDYNSATFTTNNNTNLANKDSIVKIFVKESEYPLHIIKSIQIDDVEVYKKGRANH